MEQEEREWLDKALGYCRQANNDKALVLFARRQDDNDGQDTVVTNCTDPLQITALSHAMNGFGEEDNGE